MRVRLGLVSVVAALVVSACQSSGNSEFRGSFVEAHFFVRPAGPIMLVITRGGRRDTSWRMDLIDVATGHRLLRKANDGLSLVSVGHDTERIWLQDSTGLRCRSAATLEVSQCPGPPPKPPASSSNRTTVVLPSREELHINHTDGLRRSNAAHSEYTAIEPDWRDARFGIDPCRFDAVRFADPESYVLVREVSEGVAKFADVMRLAPDGKPLWTTRLKWGEVQVARLEGQRLVIVLATPEQTAFALDAADGHVLWRYEL